MSVVEADNLIARSPARPAGWIISRRDDLVWLQGSVLPALGLLALFALWPRLTDATYSATHPAVIALLCWGVLFDGTHVMGTYARTYLAPDPASRAALPGHSSFGLLLVGPALAMVDHAWLPQGPSVLGHAGPLFRYFLMGAYLWAYWHLIRQHYGFLVLYARRAGQADRMRPDVWLLWAGCLYPYLRYALSPAYVASGLPLLLPASALPALRTGLDLAAGIALLGLVAWRLGTPEGRKLAPKDLLLVIVIGFHCAVFATLDNLLCISATLTLFHNLQYHRIVWQYEQGKGRVPLGGLGRYLGLGVLLGLIWYGPRVMGIALVQGDLGRNLLLGLGWGFAFHHYFVDGRIWRVRRSKDVAAALEAR